MASRRVQPDPYSRRFWDALDRLEHEVDGLSTRILKRTEAPPKTARTAKASETQDDASLFIERIDALTKTVSILRESIDAPASELPAPAKRRKLRRIVHPEIYGDASTAHRARVGRAARRHGMSFREWVDRYGMVDKLPTP